MLNSSITYESNIDQMACAFTEHGIKRCLKLFYFIKKEIIIKNCYRNYIFIKLKKHLFSMGGKIESFTINNTHIDVAIAFKLTK